MIPYFQYFCISQMTSQVMITACKAGLLPGAEAGIMITETRGCQTGGIPVLRDDDAGHKPGAQPTTAIEEIVPSIAQHLAQ